MSRGEGGTSSTIPEKDLTGCMKWIRDMREWAFRNGINPFALRQAIIMALEMDTDAALARGIRPEALKAFDDEVIKDAKEWIRQRRARGGP